MGHQSAILESIRARQISITAHNSASQPIDGTEFKNFVPLFGELFKNWPDMMIAAPRLREHGIRMSSSVCCARTGGRPISRSCWKSTTTEKGVNQPHVRIGEDFAEATVICLRNIPD
jgi:hypothetical protein